MKRLNYLCCAMLLVAGLSACSEEKEYVAVGPNWAALNQVQQGENSFQVTIKGPESIQLNEELKFAVHSAQNGYLWLVQVDPNDTVSLIFPNEIDSDNRISADQWQTVPGKTANWTIQAQEPIGPSVIAAIVTNEQMTLEDVFNEITSRQANMDKALRIVSQKAAWGLDKRVVDVKR